MPANVEFSRKNYRKFFGDTREGEYFVWCGDLFVKITDSEAFNFNMGIIEEFELTEEVEFISDSRITIKVD